MATATAKREDVKATERTAPHVDPKMLVPQDHQFRHWFIRLPPDFITDDLKIPSAWTAVQKDKSKALVKFDHVFLVANDESWAASAIVSAADGTGVTLTALKLHDMPVRTRPLFSDGTYRVAWSGRGYIVERIADSHPMTGPVHNEALAERELARLYPQRAAG